MQNEARMAKDWKNLAKTIRFHVPDHRETPFEPEQIAAHKRVLRIGLIFGALGLVIGIARRLKR